MLYILVTLICTDSLKRSLKISRNHLFKGIGPLINPSLKKKKKIAESDICSMIIYSIKSSIEMQVIFPVIIRRYFNVSIIKKFKKYIRILQFISINYLILNVNQDSCIYFKYRIFNVFTEHLKFQKYESIRNAFSLFNYIYLINRFNRTSITIYSDGY